MNNNQETDGDSPLQSLDEYLAQELVHRSRKIPASGLACSFALWAILYFCIVMFCAWMVADSIGKWLNLSSFTVLFILIVILIALYIYFRIIFASKLPVEKVTERYFNLQIMVAILAFIQSAIWVLQPENPNHEPRSVFLIAVSGLLAYMRTRSINVITAVRSSRTENGNTQPLARVDPGT